MLRNLNYAQCLNIAPIEKTWFRLQRNILSLFIALIDKAWFYERLFFEVVIIMVEDKKTKDTMSIKISFMVYMKWTIVMLSVDFKNLKWFKFFFSLLFSFYYHFQLVEGQF